MEYMVNPSKPLLTDTLHKVSMTSMHPRLADVSVMHVMLAGGWIARTHAAPIVNA
jgi:hypothetical protein